MTEIIQTSSSVRLQFFLLILSIFKKVKTLIFRTSGHKPVQQMGSGPSTPDSNLEQLKLVLIGSHSAGKNTVGNLILGGRYFTFWTSWSRTCVEKYRKVDDYLITIVRTPGWYNLKKSDKKTKDQIKNTFQKEKHDAVLLVLNLKSATFDRSEQAMLERLLTTSVWKKTVVVFTYGDTLTERGIKIEDHIDPDFNDLIQKCGNRYFVVDGGTGDAYYNQGKMITDAVKNMKQGNNDQMETPSDEDDDNEDDDKNRLLIRVTPDEFKRLQAERDLNKQRKKRIPKVPMKNKEPVAVETEMNTLSESQGPESTTDRVNTSEQGQIDRREWMKTLSDIMQNLPDDNFKKMKHYFKSIDGTIPAAGIENKEGHDMPDVLVYHFGVNDSVIKTRDVMKFLPRLDLKDKLMPYLSTLGEPWSDDKVSLL